MVEVAVDGDEIVNFGPRYAVVALPAALTGLGHDWVERPAGFLFDLPGQRAQRLLASVDVAAGQIPAAREQPAAQRPLDDERLSVSQDDRTDDLLTVRVCQQMTGPHTQPRNRYAFTSRCLGRPVACGCMLSATARSVPVP